MDLLRVLPNKLLKRAIKKGVVNKKYKDFDLSKLLK
tara:strand:+ start:4703 stop:4810 length:108 start_codon:yes stop_codon:yes gene_type:complete